MAQVVGSMVEPPFHYLRASECTPTVVPIRIESEFIIPFGKLGCESHHRRGSDDGFIEIRRPNIYINRARRVPVTLDRFSEVFPQARQNASNLTDPTNPAGLSGPPGACGPPGAACDDPFHTADMMCDVLRSNCDLQTSYEHLFLSLYFDRIKKNVEAEALCGRNGVEIRNHLRRHLMPLPQAHLYYLTDFTLLPKGEVRQECVKVDVAFWTGQRFIAVLLDRPGAEQHQAHEDDLLRLWGMEVFHFDTCDTESWQNALVFSQLCEVPGS